MLSIAELPGAKINHIYRIFEKDCRASIRELDPRRGVVASLFLVSLPAGRRRRRAAVGPASGEQSR